MRKLSETNLPSVFRKELTSFLVKVEQSVKSIASKKYKHALQLIRPHHRPKNRSSASVESLVDDVTQDIIEHQQNTILVLQIEPNSGDFIFGQVKTRGNYPPTHMNKVLLWTKGTDVRICDWSDDELTRGILNFSQTCSHLELGPFFRRPIVQDTVVFDDDNYVNTSPPEELHSNLKNNYLIGNLLHDIHHVRRPLCLFQPSCKDGEDGDRGELRFGRFNTMNQILDTNPKTLINCVVEIVGETPPRLQNFKLTPAELNASRNNFNKYSLIQPGSPIAIIDSNYPRILLVASVTKNEGVVLGDKHTLTLDNCVTHYSSGGGGGSERISGTLSWIELLEAEKKYKKFVKPFCKRLLYSHKVLFNNKHPVGYVTSINWIPKSQSCSYVCKFEHSTRKTIAYEDIESYTCLKTFEYSSDTIFTYGNDNSSKHFAVSSDFHNNDLHQFLLKDNPHLSLFWALIDQLVRLAATSPTRDFVWLCLLGLNETYATFDKLPHRNNNSMKNKKFWLEVVSGLRKLCTRVDKDHLQTFSDIFAIKTAVFHVIVPTANDTYGRKNANKMFKIKTYYPRSVPDSGADTSGTHACLIFVNKMYHSARRINVDLSAAATEVRNTCLDKMSVSLQVAQALLKRGGQSESNKNPTSTTGLKSNDAKEIDSNGGGEFLLRNC